VYTPSQFIYPIFSTFYLFSFTIILLGIIGLILRQVHLNILTFKKSVILTIILLLLIHAYGMTCIDIFCVAPWGESSNSRCGFTCAGLSEAQTAVFFPILELLYKISIPVSILLSIPFQAGFEILRNIFSRKSHRLSPSYSRQIEVRLLISSHT
jgi:hypothetical protein